MSQTPSEKGQKGTIDCRIIKCLLVFFEKHHGADKLREVVAGAGLAPHIDLSYLSQQDNWIRVEDAQALLDALCIASKQPAFARFAGHETFSREVLDVAYTVLKAFGTPSATYAGLVSRADIYNRAGRFQLKSTGKYKIELVYTPHVPESNPHFCELRKGQFEAVPRLWGLPLANVRETECSALGAEACRYDIAWTQRPGFRSALILSLLCGAAVMLAERLLISSSHLSWEVAAASAVAFASLAAHARYSLSERDTILGVQNQDLLESLTRLQESQRTLEERIVRRTNTLQETQKKLELSLAEAGKDAEAKSRFVAGISHELRTPLTLLLMAAGELAQHPEDLRPENEIAEIQRQGLLLFRYVEHLLEYAAIEAGVAKVQLEQANLGALVTTWSQDSARRASSQGVRLEVVQEGDIPDSFFDVEKIQSAYINLLGNALKFTATGSITCRVRADSQTVTVEVADTGRGIPTESLAHVFERFYQGEPGAERTQGTGLGLTIAKENVQLHKGSMTVESELGKGSTFKITLPIEPNIVERRQKSRRREDRVLTAPQGDFAIAQQLYKKAAMLADVDEAIAADEAQSEHETLSQPEAGAATVLVVEDNENLRARTVRALKRHFHVHEAANGKRGLQAAKEYLPDIIVSDVQMPEMNGQELCLAVRRVAALRAVPFIFVSADNSAKSKFAGFAAGAVDYIIKPYDPEELIARIKAQWEMRKAAVEFEEKNTRLAAIGQVCAQIVHDLRSPLQAIMSDVQYCDTVVEDIKGVQTEVAKDKTYTELKEVFSSLDDGVKRSNRMLDNVLSFVRTGVEKLEKKPTALGHWLRDVVSGLTPYLEAASIATHVEVGDGDLTFRCDAEQLRRGIENLLRNARDALMAAQNERAQKQKELWIKIWEDAESICIRIADNGDGIPISVQERLGGAYFTHGKVGGTGLGLAVTWNVVAAHDGKISIEGEPVEGGAAFVIRFPRVTDKALGNS